MVDIIQVHLGYHLHNLTVHFISAYTFKVISLSPKVIFVIFLLFIEDSNLASKFFIYSLFFLLLLQISLLILFIVNLLYLMNMQLLLMSYNFHKVNLLKFWSISNLYKGYAKNQMLKHE